MNTSKLRNLLPLILALPSILIGTIAMHSNNVSLVTLSQNLVSSLILGAISYLVLSRKIALSIKNSFAVGIPITLSFIFIVLTFSTPGIEGVHRWVAVGPIKFYVASIVLPIMIIKLWDMAKIHNWWSVTSLTMIMSLLLTLQPDASQATAFITSMLIILWNTTNKHIYRFIVLSLLIPLIIISWVYLDNLPPVAYVEEIIQLVANMGFVWLIFGVISLMILPLSFLFFSTNNLKLLNLSLTIYYFIILISTVLGNFPVPLMGYGISPIIGYFIAITWLLKAIDNKTPTIV